MKYNFDIEVDRQGTNSIKWEFIQREDAMGIEHTDKFSGDNRTLSMWIADMDFPCPQPVVDALIERSAKAIYGYTAPTKSFFDAVVNWIKKRHHWEISPEWICLSPGIVPALNMLVQTFVIPGGKVLVQPPVYYPFFHAIKNNNAEIVASSLVNHDNYYKMDFDNFEEKAKDPKVKMAILCNPHNPVGRVWSKEELTRFGEICLKNDMLIIADEVHGDLIYKGSTFTPFASINNEFLMNTLTCTAPSKTFNLAGLQTANIIIQNESLRNKFQKTLISNGLFHLNTFGVVALEVAYNQGEEWLEQVMDYLENNLNYLQEYLALYLPQITMIRPEGTYLVWLDCRKLGFHKFELKKLMFEKVGVYFDEGFIFGSEGDGFERINIACPRSILEDALGRMKKVIGTL